MVDNAVTTLAPEQKSSDILTSLPPLKAVPDTTETKALFDSLSHDEYSDSLEPRDSPLKTFFAGLLWSGYAVAVVVAVILVWSAVSSMMKAMSQ